MGGWRGRCEAYVRWVSRGRVCKVEIMYRICTGEKKVERKGRGERAGQIYLACDDCDAQVPSGGVETL